jgi:hypothetical protein
VGSPWLSSSRVLIFAVEKRYRKAQQTLGKDCLLITSRVTNAGPQRSSPPRGFSSVTRMPWTR